MNNHDSICERLDWDSDFFGLNIARMTAGRLTESAAAQARAWCERHRIDCLYFLADAADSTTVRAAEANGFQLVDMRLTLEWQLKNVPAVGVFSDAVRLGTALDGPALRSIAAKSHQDSRFYFDPHFLRSRCDALYQTWIEKSLNGDAEAVLVAEWDGEAVGYSSCHLQSSSTGRVGLFAVASEARGRGLGQYLVEESLRWFAKNGIVSVTVVTQGRNPAAQRVYQRSGFLTQSLQLWYHRWF